MFLAKPVTLRHAQLIVNFQNGTTVTHAQVRVVMLYSCANALLQSKQNTVGKCAPTAQVFCTKKYKVTARAVMDLVRVIV